MWKKWMVWLTAVGALGLIAVLIAAACSSSNGKSCTKDEECAADEYCANDGKCHKRVVPDGGGDGENDGGDTGIDEGPPPCQRDIDCPPDQVCRDGECVPGEKTCQHDYNCDRATEFCDPDGGICKQRSALCEPCYRDIECPDPTQNDRCIPYSDGHTYCGQACGVRGCPIGYDCDRTQAYGEGPNPYQCRSNTGSCEGTFICYGDSDCPSNKVCDMMTGVCVPKCSSDQNCAPGKKCHYTGHCGAPCSGDNDCDVYGEDLICCLSPAQEWCDANSTGRCRPDGCVLHSECLLDPLNNNHSYGYCDQRTHECKTGCRTANNGVVEDCTSGYRCTCPVAQQVACDEMDCCNDPGSGGCLCDPEFEDCSQVMVCDDGVCEKIPCHERGDVSIACARNQVCCGWPLEDGYPCPDGTEEGECYTAVPPVCATCSEDAECDFTADGYGYGEKGVCLEDMDGNNYCHLGCRDSQDCPSTWQCSYTFFQYCDQDNPCEPSASCEMYVKTEDGQYDGCHCLTDADCPEDINGFRARCQDVQICDYTVEPVECHQGKICLYAKACQCSNCCGQIASGG
ncbi:MAG: hypothetical protein JXR96_07885 [Deltaproteobacteria bacterium]|nr:hypothetical protein [Deltaproteobacteria bacterium]